MEVHLAREGIPARVDGRLKRAYSVFQKLKRQKITLDQVYDLLGRAHHHGFGEELLRRAGRDSQRMASHSRAASRISSRFRGRICINRCTLR